MPPLVPPNQATGQEHNHYEEHCSEYRYETRLTTRRQLVPFYSKAGADAFASRPYTSGVVYARHGE